jgi:serine beta-lactamase-like protein LACTB
MHRALNACLKTAVTLLAVAPGTAVAQGVRLAEAPAPGQYGRAIAESRVLIDSLMEANVIPGLSIAVSVDGATVWSEGFGWANIESQAPVTPLTKFRVGSISKSLAAAALGQLYEQGKLDLDAPVQQYVPSFPRKAKGTVTTRLVAGHLAGIRHYSDANEMLFDNRYETVLDGLKIFQNDTLLFAPGSRYSYSTFGWNLLSAVVEGASGESFLDYMRRHVFEPLGMRHTVADHTDSIIIGRTGFYQPTRDGRIVNAPDVDNSYKWAGGGYLSTPEDLLRFANAHLRGEIVSPKTVDLWWTSQRTASGEETGYGMGWSTRMVDGHKLVGHTGGSVGGNSALMIIVDAGVVVAIATNTSSARLAGIPNRIARRFIN